MSAAPGGYYRSEKLSNLGVGPPPFRRQRAISPRKRRGRAPDQTIYCRSSVVTLSREVVHTSLTFMMMKKKNRRESAMKIIAIVKREMQKSRLAESVLSDNRRPSRTDRQRPARAEKKVMAGLRLSRDCDH